MDKLDLIAGKRIGNLDARLEKRIAQADAAIKKNIELRRVAKALTETVSRATDLCARYGGEEFAVLLTDIDGALMVAESVRERIEGYGIPHRESKAAACVSVSIGVAALVPERGDMPDALIAAADTNLYRAKDTGRNRCCAATDVMV